MPTKISDPSEDRPARSAQRGPGPNRSCDTIVPECGDVRTMDARAAATVTDHLAGGTNSLKWRAEIQKRQHQVEFFFQTKEQATQVPGPESRPPPIPSLGSSS